MAKGILISFLIIAIGLAWLLNTLEFIRGVDWIWTLSLGAVGVIMLAWGKLNKLTFVMGSFMVIASLFSVLRQTNVIRIDIEIPVLVMVFGVLFLIAQLPMIPWPTAMLQMREAEERERAGK